MTADRLRLLVALLLLSGCEQKVPKCAAGLDFASYGDCRHQTDIHRKIAGSIVASGSRFTLVTGDLVDLAEDPSAWETFHDITKVLRKNPYDCAPGDHDTGAKGYFEKELGLQRLYWDRRDGEYHIFVLDSGGRFSEPDQLAWLEKTAGTSTAKHKFAVFHHPPFGIQASRAAATEELRPRIHPLLVKLNFCAAFCGHQHSFYTTLRDRVRYVVTAGGGASLYNIDPSLGQAGDLSRKFYHFVGCTVSGSKILAHVYDPDGIEDESLAFTLCEHP
ncbi:MAG TPA: metallophosphoesterase [Planctomycetota bacterium]|nr:metallophosphoesterase [Planctomycetota bacterium]